MSLDLTSWIAVASIALSLIAKVCTDYQPVVFTAQRLCYEEGFIDPVFEA
jgi:hypothetical protein